MAFSFLSSSIVLLIFVLNIIPFFNNYIKKRLILWIWERQPRNEAIQFQRPELHSLYIFMCNFILINNSLLYLHSTVPHYCVFSASFPKCTLSDLNRYHYPEDKQEWHRVDFQTNKEVYLVAYLESKPEGNSIIQVCTHFTSIKCCLGPIELYQ